MKKRGKQLKLTTIILIFAIVIAIVLGINNISFSNQLKEIKRINELKIELEEKKKLNKELMDELKNWQDDYLKERNKGVTDILEVSKNDNFVLSVNYTQSSIREVSAYNVGDPSQTDTSPCIAANGENICLALEIGYKRCAANFVPFGTRLMIDYYGECLVTDRMNARYQNRVDVAMSLKEKDRALKWGVQRLNVLILK